MSGLELSVLQNTIRAMLKMQMGNRRYLRKELFTSISENHILSRKKKTHTHTHTYTVKYRSMQNLIFWRALTKHHDVY